MKPLLKIVALVVVVLIVAVVGAIAVTSMGRQAITDGFETNGIRIVKKDGIVSSAVVPLGPGQVALVDAGSDGAGEANARSASSKAPKGFTVLSRN